MARLPTSRAAVSALLIAGCLSLALFPRAARALPRLRRCLRNLPSPQAAKPRGGLRAPLRVEVAGRGARVRDLPRPPRLRRRPDLAAERERRARRLSMVAALPDRQLRPREPQRQRGRVSRHGLSLQRRRRGRVRRRHHQPRLRAGVRRRRQRHQVHQVRIRRPLPRGRLSLAALLDRGHGLRGERRPRPHLRAPPPRRSEHGRSSVQQKIADYLARLVEMGVHGFRVDAAKHIAPAELKAILQLVSDAVGPDRAPYYFFEVIDQGNEAIKASDYLDVAGTSGSTVDITEFKYARIDDSFLNRNDKTSLHPRRSERVELGPPAQRSSGRLHQQPRYPAQRRRLLSRRRPPRSRQRLPARLPVRLPAAHVELRIRSKDRRRPQQGPSLR